MYKVYSIANINNGNLLVVKGKKGKQKLLYINKDINEIKKDIKILQKSVNKGIELGVVELTINLKYIKEVDGHPAHYYHGE